MKINAMTAKHPSTPGTDVDGAIRNPANPNHFMVVQRVGRRLQIHIDGVRIAETNTALRVIEIGHHAYEPRLYIPVGDVTAELTKSDKTTHCPLKGDASYYALNGTEVGWRYDPFDFAKILEGHLSFFGDNLTITEG